MVYTRISEIDKKDYEEFYRFLAEDDFNFAQKIIAINPRWSFIVGYYAMHNLTKYYLCKEHWIKIRAPEEHKDALVLLRERINQSNIKKKLIELYEKATVEYEKVVEEYNVERFAQQFLPDKLEKARQEREKSTYYGRSTDRSTVIKSINEEKAKDFFENTVVPFVKTLRELCGEK